MVKCVWRALSAVLVGTIAAAAQDACRITQTTVEGVKEVVLENAYVRLRFVPSRGGVCTGFFDKRAKAEWPTPTTSSGMLDVRDVVTGMAGAATIELTE